MNEVINIGDFLELSADNLPSPATYQYYRNLMNRKIVINQGINEDLLELAVLPFLEMDNDGTGEPIEIILSTAGGNVYDGYTLISALENAKSPVIIRIMSMAASMGILIAMAGKNNPNVKTVCHPFSVGLIHSGSQCMEGTTHALKDTFDFSQKYDKRIKEYIISHSNIDEELYDRIERKEYWIDSSEMLELGIVDEII